MTELSDYKRIIEKPQLERLNKEISALRADLEEYYTLKQYAASLGQRTYLELHAENERLRADRDRLREALKLCADAKMPGEARRLAHEALQSTGGA